MAKINVSPTIEDFQRAVNAITVDDKFHSLYVTKNGIVKSQGRIGALFTSRSTFQRSTELFLAQYGAQCNLSFRADLRACIESFLDAKYKPLNALIVKDLIKLAQTPTHLTPRVDNITVPNLQKEPTPITTLQDSNPNSISKRIQFFEEKATLNAQQKKTADVVPQSLQDTIETPTGTKNVTAIKTATPKISHSSSTLEAKRILTEDQKKMVDVVPQSLQDTIETPPSAQNVTAIKTATPKTSHPSSTLKTKRILTEDQKNLLIKELKKVKTENLNTDPDLADDDDLEDWDDITLDDDEVEYSTDKSTSLVPQNGSATETINSKSSKPETSLPSSTLESEVPLTEDQKNLLAEKLRDAVEKLKNTKTENLSTDPDLVENDDSEDWDD